MAILFGRGSFAKLAPEASYATTGSFKTNAINKYNFIKDVEIADNTIEEK